MTTSHLSSDENDTSFCGQPQNGCPLFYTLKSKKEGKNAKQNGKISHPCLLLLVAQHAFIARKEIRATVKQHICDMQFNAVTVALKS